MDIRIHPVDAARRADFFRLHSPENECDFCYCAAWWVPSWEGWSERTSEANRKLREDLFERGEFDGYLLYVDGVPGAWAQVGRRDRLTHLTGDYRLEPDPYAWAITCFLVAPSLRRRGLARRLLDFVLKDLERQGVRRVQAFPRRGADLTPERLWTGPEAMFLSAGFDLVREDARRPILERQLGRGAPAVE
jgi:GNAT superfamily N-acetyltransferase